MSSGFISESEILEARRRRQEEWDKVRTEEQPKGLNGRILMHFSIIFKVLTAFLYCVKILFCNS